MPAAIGPRLVSLVGLVYMIGLAWACSENRWKVNWRLVVWGVGLQIAVAVLILKTPLESIAFPGMAAAVDLLTQSTLAGAGFVFGNLSTDFDIDAIIAFQALPVIIFVSAIAAILYHLRVIQS